MRFHFFIDFFACLNVAILILFIFLVKHYFNAIGVDFDTVEELPFANVDDRGSIRFFFLSFGFG